MNKNLHKILLLCFSLSASLGFAQNVKTGIGTADPKQTLHVARVLTNAGEDAESDTGQPIPSTGAQTGVFLTKPTVRVDGLNSTNNTANQPADASALRRVYANQDGDLVLVNSNLERQIIAQETSGDPIPTQSIVSLAGVGDFEKVKLKEVSFTLEHPSVVYFSASFATVLRQTLVLPIMDGEAKLYGGYFQFSVAPAGVSTTAAFGRNRKTYATDDGNPLTLTDLNGVPGDFVLNPREQLVLPAGEYTVYLYGELYTRLLGGLLSYAKFGDTSNAVGESFLINATPIQYQ